MILIVVATDSHVPHNVESSSQIELIDALPELSLSIQRLKANKALRKVAN